MAAAATQLQITIITPQWLDLPENEKENASSSSSSVSEQQQQQQELENEAIQMITEENNKRTTTQKFEPIHEWQKQKFDEWLTKNSFNMYPTRDEKEKLAEMLSASYAQITRLFANQRRRTHKKGGKGTTIKEDETSPISLITTIPKILTIESPTTDPSEINENSIEQINKDTTINSISRSSSPAIPSFEDNNIAAICSAVADQIHVDQENKKSFEPQPIPPPTKKRQRKRKSKKISWDEKLLETTVDEILNKISRKGPANDNDIQKEQTDIIQIKVDEKIEKSSSKGLRFF
uniref:Homeobox domain-containing protein n=1 Tax=Panagrolaimus sp. PS1159 TaxID=55785 RepID=A0AC35G7L1_9BILA